MSLVLEVLTGAVTGGTAILYAASGETISERAGVVNLGTEGAMLVGALAAYAVAAETGSAWAGVAAAGLAGGLLALVFAWFVIDRKANQLATGLLVLFLALGLTSLFGGSYVGAQVKALKAWPVPLLSRIPWVGQVLFRHDPLTYLSFLLVPAIWWLLFRSRWGVLLRAAGERSEVLSTYGHRVAPLRYLAVVAGGVLGGIGGAHISIAYANAWFENMIQGRGFIAVAVVIFAARQPFRVAAGAWLFGAALALSPALQARGYGINQFALDALPYVLTIVVLVVVGRRGVTEAPEELKKVFETAGG
ncbi:MAG: inner-rane translocator [Acidimicrobiales bacterium]|nr:inner-rane translocator [Acidimicrobiales bacterium]